MKFFYFANTRRPDFSSIQEIDYNEYWRARGFMLNKKLKEREGIIFHWIPKGSCVADFGCGNSLLPVKLKEKGCRMTVGDISDTVLGGFHMQGISSMKMNLEEVHASRFEERFDYVILSEVLEHTRNPEEIIGTLKKHTKYFVITIPNSAFYRYRLHLMFAGRFFTQWVHHPSEHIRFWSHTDFLDWLTAMGLRIEKTRASNGFTVGRLLDLKNIWKNLFGHQIVYLARVL